MALDTCCICRTTYPANTLAASTASPSHSALNPATCHSISCTGAFSTACGTATPMYQSRP